jgi:ligand-binding sensor domain-containing protein/serine phosphatase RsbU (regulator of sigma subunit)
MLPVPTGSILFMPGYRMLKNLIIVAITFLFLGSGAQTFHFTGYGVKDGLIQSNVSSIVQDSAGFYWIGTAGGLSRFDGRHFVNFTTEQGLSDNNITALFIDRDHQLWIGHDNGLVTRYDGVTFTGINSKQLPKDKKILGFFQDKLGSIWISTSAAGVIRIMDISRKASKGRAIRTYSARDGLSHIVLKVTEDNEGNMWFNTDIGVKVLRKGKADFEFFHEPGMPPGQIAAILKLRDGGLLFGTLNGTIFRFDTKSRQFTMIVSPSDLIKKMQLPGPYYIYTLMEDRKGNIWASITNLGVIRVEKNNAITWFNTSNGLTVNKIKSIIEDEQGNVLFGTEGEGIEVFAGEKFVSFNKHNGLSDNQVWAICKDRNGHYWFGTNGGITIYNPSEHESKAFRILSVKEGLPNNNIRSIVEDRNGNIWIAMWGGKVIRYDVGASRLVPVPALEEIVNGYANCLLIDKRNFLWIGSNEGIVRYDLHSGALRTFRTIDGLVDNDISCLFEDSKGNVWIGTNKNGVSMFDGRKFINHNKTSGLPNGNVSAISEDKDHKIWIGTEGAGVYLFNGKNYTAYKVRNGLSSDFVTLVSPDADGNMWLGTNKGLNRFDFKTGQFTIYSEGDGFTGLETKQGAIYLEKSGDLWFGTVNGVFRYRPTNDSASVTAPRVKLLQFRVNLKEAPLQGETELSYKENNLAFDYIGISLNDPTGVYYKIKLEGFDEDYRTVRATTEVYSNLQHGTYHFRLIGCNKSGICSKPLTVKIVITPPYWKTWWFYLIVFTVISGSLFLYIKVRERKLMIEKRILEEKVNERTAEVVQKNKELDEINKDITASIRYAKRIQDAILPPDDFVRQNLPEAFILFKPKDIVSGDFYFMEKKEDVVVFAAVDCTGHGVPGAFMSIVGHNLLDRVIGEQNITKPASILDELNRGLSDTLRQTNLEDNTVRDGMDVSLCAYNARKNVLEFAGAYNPLWLIRSNELIEVKANKFPIGNTRSGEGNKFTNHEINLQKGDTIYIFSDGYSDQFGGPEGKKFKSSALKTLLLNSQKYSMKEQREILNTAIENWRGQHEQVDDILVIGARFN